MKLNRGLKKMTESLTQKQETDILLLSDTEWEEWKKKSRKALMLLILKTFAKVILAISMVTGLVYLMWGGI
jgi:hypothetical protein